MNTGAWRKCLPLALYFASHTQWHAACFLSFFYNLSRKEKEWSKIEWIMEKSDIDRQRNTRKLGMGKKHIFKGYPHIPVSNVLSSHSSPDWSAVVGLCWGGRKKNIEDSEKKRLLLEYVKLKVLFEKLTFSLESTSPDDSDTLLGRWSCAAAVPMPSCFFFLFPPNCRQFLTNCLLCFSILSQSRWCNPNHGPSYRTRKRFLSRGKMQSFAFPFGVWCILHDWDQKLLKQVGQNICLHGERHTV